MKIARSTCCNARMVSVERGQYQLVGAEGEDGTYPAILENIYTREWRCRLCNRAFHGYETLGLIVEVAE